MAKYQKYADYKDSGVEWLRDIPKSWFIGDFRRGIDFLTDFEANGSFADVKANVDLDSEEKFAWYVRATDLQNLRFGMVDGNRTIDSKAYSFLNKTTLYGGELLVAKRGEIGKVYLMPKVSSKATLAPNLYLIRLNNLLNPKYTFFWFLSLYGKPQLELADKSTTIGALYKDDVKACQMLYPSYKEQTAIANFLDYETAKIDNLIAKQEMLIELLKEKRQAVISHAVTKGLNPNAPMKDSGVEWLGEVPEHWLVSPLKYLIASKRGAVKAGPFGSHLKNSDMEGGDVKVISQKNVIANDLYIGEAMISEQKYRELEVFTIEQDDILVTTRGTIGRTCIFKEKFTAILHPCLIRLQVDTKKVIPELIALIIQESGYEMEQILVKSNATTIEVIYSDNLINTLVVIPKNLSEQSQILNYISEQKAYFDKVLAKANQMIKGLSERRTALISAAVTGKIDVRNWQHPNKKNNNNTELSA